MKNVQKNQMDDENEHWRRQGLKFSCPMQLRSGSAKRTFVLPMVFKGCTLLTMKSHRMHPVNQLTRAFIGPIYS